MLHLYHNNFFIETYVQNFYLLKIHLNLFEISYWVLKFENLISICKSIILSRDPKVLWTIWQVNLIFCKDKPNLLQKWT